MVRRPSMTALNSLIRKGRIAMWSLDGNNRKVAVKIVDDRGIESLKIVNLED